jgi:hypothetical protein
VIEFSKGDSKQEFSAYTMQQGTTTFFLLNAYHFDMEFARRDVLGLKMDPHVLIQGPRVTCSGPDYCENSWDDFFESNRDRQKKSAPRRQRAIELIKKACPGKPY